MTGFYMRVILTATALNHLSKKRLKRLLEPKGSTELNGTLTHYSHVTFLHSLKMSRNHRFLTFSKVIEMWHWTKIGYWKSHYSFFFLELIYLFPNSHKAGIIPSTFLPAETQSWIEFWNSIISLENFWCFKIHFCMYLQSKT